MNNVVKPRISSKIRDKRRLEETTKKRREAIKYKKSI
jgi:hypothetical protein